MKEVNDNSVTRNMGLGQENSSSNKQSIRNVIFLLGLFARGVSGEGDA